MGFTRYWRVRADVDPSRLIEVGRRMVEMVRASDVPLAGFDGTGEPKLESETGEVRFNGVAALAQDYETFAWPPDLLHRASDDPDWAFDFCKTGGLPYDAVVVACLEAAQQVLGDSIRVQADRVLD